MRKKIGLVVYRARKGKGMTQMRMSKIIGVSQATLSKIESGELEPRLSVWLKFCEKFEIHPATMRSTA